MTQDNLGRLIADIADTRRAEQVCREEIEAVETAIAETPLGHRLAALRTVYLPGLRSAVQVAEDAARDAALATYEHTGDKKVHPDITIRVYQVAVYDTGQALDYARAHLPTALRLDARTFEKVAKAIELDFVTWHDDARPAISKDLSKYEVRE